MKKLLRSGKALTIVLWFVAVHSFCVGVCLIVMPPSLFSYFGFGIGEKFFSIQGGVFHIVMSICYLLAASKADKFSGLIIMSIITKFMATIFLVLYFTFIDHLLLVLFSGIVDGLMGVVILFTYFSYKKTIV